MSKNDKIIIQRIQNQFDYLLYKQAVKPSKSNSYKTVYANGNGAMYYCCGSKLIPTNPTAVLIDENFKIIHAPDWVEEIKGIDTSVMLQVINQHREIYSIQKNFFDAVYLTSDNSLLIGRKQMVKSDKKSDDKKPEIALPGSNLPKNLAVLPNGMTVQRAWDDPSVYTISNKSQEIMTNIETVQSLSKNQVVILQKTAKLDDLYIVNFNATPDHYETALGKSGNNELNQGLVDAYKKRYMNIVNALLDKQKQK